jgi:uncharacterized membrane protein YphA (DoxX/SURF4 family)
MRPAAAEAARWERAWAIFVPRAMLGLVYLFAGVHKLTDIGVVAFGRRMADTDASRFVPAVVVTTVGVLTPFVELLLGALLLAGLWTRSTLRALVVLILLITAAYGVHGLLHPTGATAMNVSIVNFYILPRAALVMLLCVLGGKDDLLSIDAIRRRR